MDRNKLILLCGCPRSGTSWLSKILDSVPSVLLVSEPDKRINRNIEFGKVPHCIDDAEADMQEVYKKSIDEIIKFKYCSLRSYPYFEKNYAAVPHNLYSSISGFYQLLNYLLDRYGFNYPLKLPDFLFKKKEKVDLVWKSVNQSANIPFLQNTFPDLKIVYVLRNPYSCLASLLVHNRMKLDGEDSRRIVMISFNYEYY